MLRARGNSALLAVDLSLINPQHAIHASLEDSKACRRPSHRIGARRPPTITDGGESRNKAGPAHLPVHPPSGVPTPILSRSVPERVLYCPASTFFMSLPTAHTVKPMSASFLWSSKLRPSKMKAGLDMESKIFL